MQRLGRGIGQRTAEVLPRGASEAGVITAKQHAGEAGELTAGPDISAVPIITPRSSRTTTVRPG
ncbi:hypothetical protein [Actinoplanes sp. NPDC020271]|uniref:hypothetical protein n=1 Tax=Actinoplanes sp. NPDC020271 TaxID=3363896 RepID=UPI0037AFF963